MNKVVMKALRFGTINGAKGDILHVDPEGVERAREPIVSEEDAAILEREGLAKRTTKKVAAAGEVIEYDGVDIAAKRVKKVVKADTAVSGLASGLESRSTVAHPENVHGGQEGIGDGSGDDDASDDDDDDGDDDGDGAGGDGGSGDGAGAGTGINADDPDAPPVGGAVKKPAAPKAPKAPAAPKPPKQGN